MLSFHLKFVQTYRQTDGRTTVKQYAPPPIFRYGGIKIFSVQGEIVPQPREVDSCKTSIHDKCTCEVLIQLTEDVEGENIWGKKLKIVETSIFSFSKNVLNHHSPQFPIFSHINFAICKFIFNLDQSKNNFVV